MLQANTYAWMETCCANVQTIFYGYGLPLYLAELTDCLQLALESSNIYKKLFGLGRCSI